MTLANIIIQSVIDLLERSTWTSASPEKTNVIDDVNYGALDASFDQALQETIIELIKEYNVTAEPAEIAEDGIIPSEKRKGLTEQQLTSAASKALRGAQNPTSIVSEGLKYLPHAVLIAFALKLVPLVFKELTRPGGPYDLRFKRIIDDEINAFLSRQTQKDTEMGVRQVIIQSKTGFTATNGANNYNTLRGIREGGVNKERLTRIGMVDHSKGVFETG